MFELNVDNFNEEVKNGLVLVDFWATWCAPCRTLAVNLEALATEIPTIKFVKVNVDESDSLAERFEVRSLPTLILLKDGVEVKRRVGAASKAVLTAFCS